MTMLADHPTWPVKKSAPEKEPEEKGMYGTPLPQAQGIGIPKPPPFPTQAQQATPIAAKPCPFCGGPMTTIYVTTTALGNVSAPAQVQVGCHNNTHCIITPTVKCDQADMTRMIQLWNTRFP